MSEDSPPMNNTAQMDCTFEPVQFKATPVHDFAPGNSLQNLPPLIGLLSRKRRNLCFIGERGTGKELVADECVKFNNYSPKIEKINCASYTGDTLQSRLFGHLKGSFTDAKKDHEGAFGSLESGSSILLDELGAAPPDFHAALLRVLQFKTYSKLGSIVEVPLPEDISILAATSEPLKIRKDVLDRFMCIHIPPLRYRQGDIPAIIKKLWGEVEDTNTEEQFPDKISEAALIHLKAYSWPGNVRELKNALDFALALTQLNEEKTIRTSVFPAIPTMPLAPDTSADLKIEVLKDDGPRIPIEDFIRGWPIDSKDSEQSSPLSEDNDDHVIKCIKEIKPRDYDDAFWRYYALNGYSAQIFLQIFPDSYKKDTIQKKLRKFNNEQ